MGWTVFNKTKIKKLGFFFLFSSLPLQAGVVESLITNRDFSAASSGMGRTAVAKADDISYLSVNPVAVNQNIFMNFYLDQSIGFADNYLTYMAYGFKILDQNLAVSGAVWTPQKVTEINDYGDNVGTGSVFDAFFGITWGTIFQPRFDWVWLDVPLGKAFSGIYEIGVTGKIVHSRLLEYTANVPAFDVGGMFRKKIDSIAFLPIRNAYNLSIGATLLNLGPPVEYVQSAESQPFRWSLGFEYLIMSVKNHGFGTLMSVEKRLEREPWFSTGIEYVAYSFAKARAGYIFGDVTRGMTFGMAFAYSYYSVYDMELNYGAGIVRDFGMEHQLGFKINYNKEVLSNRVSRVSEESRKIYDSIDEEIMAVAQNCVDRYHRQKEFLPPSLMSVKPCFVDHGFNDIPQPLSGLLAYNSKNGKVTIDPLPAAGGGEKIMDDEIYLLDGSMIKGTVTAISERQIVLLNDLGQVQIERDLVNYYRLVNISPEESELLLQAEQIIAEFKSKTGRYPKDIAEINKVFVSEFGMTLPDPLYGRYLYNQGKGNLQIVDNYSGKSDKKSSLEKKSVDVSQKTKNSAAEPPKDELSRSQSQSHELLLD